jgi:hypothetical protein
MPPESSSEDVALSGNDQVTSSTDVNASGNSSAPETGVEKLGMMERVEAALKPDAEESPASEGGKENAEPDAQASGAEAEGEEGKLPELTEDEIKSYPPNSQRRIRELVDKSHEKDKQVEEVSRQADSYKTRAEEYDRVVTYMRDNRITPGEFDNALTITALINSGDHRKALEVLTPIYRELATKAGEYLPEDLKRAVQLGEITEAHARELSRNRAQVKVAEERQARTAEEQKAAEETQRYNTLKVSNAKAVDDWAKAKAGSDPDWHLKQSDVADQVQLLLQREGMPSTKEEAVKMAERALEKVEQRVKAYRPAPKPADNRNPVTGQFASSRSTAKPKTLMEAVEKGLATANG